MTLLLELTPEEEARLARAAGSQGLDVVEYARFHLLELAEQAETIEAIREGLEDVAAGRTRPARKALCEFGRRHGL